jgi:hypothetical protein
MSNPFGEMIPHVDNLRTISREEDEARRRRESEKAAELIRTHNEQVAAEAKRREQAAHARGLAELEEYREQCRRAFLDASGTVDEFGKSWPEMKAEYLKRAAVERLTAADKLREQMRPTFPRL